MADTSVLGTDLKRVGVQVPPSAPTIKNRSSLKSPNRKHSLR